MGLTRRGERTIPLHSAAAAFLGNSKCKSCTEMPWQYFFMLQITSEKADSPVQECSRESYQNKGPCVSLEIWETDSLLSQIFRKEVCLIHSVWSAPVCNIVISKSSFPSTSHPGCTTDGPRKCYLHSLPKHSQPSHQSHVWHLGSNKANGLQTGLPW